MCAVGAGAFVLGTGVAMADTFETIRSYDSSDACLADIEQARQDYPDAHSITCYHNPETGKIDLQASYR